jgi:MFS family permease
MLGRRFLVTVSLTVLPPLAYTATAIFLAPLDDGLRWSKNDPAFSLFALFILPILFGLLVSCIDWTAIREWGDRISLYTTFGVLTVCGLVVVAADVTKERPQPDEPRPSALTAPLLLRDHAAALAMERTLRSHLPQPRHVLISNETDAEKKAASDAEAKYETTRKKYSDIYPGWTTFRELCQRGGILAWLGLATNVVAALFCAWVLCYLLILVRVRRFYKASNVDSLIVVLSFALLWFPCRVYSDWYANFYTVRSTLVSYGAFWLAAALAVLAILLLVVVLSRQKPLSKTIGTASAVLGVGGTSAVAWKPAIAFYAAEAFERVGTPFVIVFAIVAAGSLIVLIEATRDAPVQSAYPESK